MAQVINTNIMSLEAQNNLNTTQSSLNMSMERLSSGLRINSAQDDPAGYAIAQQMTTQVNGLSQSVRNANDGISLAQTAQGALTQVTNSLQAIRELAVEAANGTNSATDRADLNTQVQQDLAQVDQIATSTSFNGQNLLDGSFGQGVFQVGANVGQTVAVNLATSVRTSAIGQTADYVNSTTAYSSALGVGQQGTGVTGNALLSGGLTIAINGGQATSVGGSVAGAAQGQTSSSAYAKAQAINSADIAGLTATADTTAQVAFTNVTAAGYSLTVNGQAIFTNATGAVTPITGDQVATQINTNSSATGVTAAFNQVTGVLTLNASDGRNVAVSQTSGTGGQGLGALTNGANVTNNTANAADTFVGANGATVANTLVGSVRLTAPGTITLGGTQATDIGYTNNTSLALGNAALSGIDVTTVANANTAITRVDAALTTVTNLAAQIGAISNRFSATIANLQTGVQNITAARSTIQDADFAAETANLTRAQILQQAGTAILAQANTNPQSVLTLLKA